MAAAGLAPADANKGTWDQVMAWLGIGRQTSSGQTVTPGSSMGLSAYYAAIRNISEDVGKLPLRVYNRTAAGKEIAVGNPVNRLLAIRPSDEIRPSIFKQTLTAHALGYGNGYAEIERDGMGNPVALHPIHPDRVTVMRDTRTKLIVYRVKVDGAGSVLIPAADMIHIMGMGGDGLVGYSVAQFAAEALGEALAAQKQSSAFFGNGMQLGGVLESPARLSKEARANLIASWEARHQGADKAGKVALLEEGLKFQPTAVNAKDAQFIELRKFHVTDIARWFRIPPHKIGDLERATFSNIEHQGIEYVQDTLLPWLVRWEEEVDAKLLPEDGEAFAKFSVQALMRGDSVARSNYYRNQLMIGSMSINEIRALEDMNGIGEQGDQYYMQTAMTTIEAINAGATAPVTAEAEKQDTSDMFNEMDDEAKAARAGMMRPVVSAAIARCWFKEEKATARARAKYQTANAQDDLARWWAEFRQEQAAYFAESMAPALASVGCGRAESAQVRSYFDKLYASRAVGDGIDPVAVQEAIIGIMRGDHAEQV